MRAGSFILVLAGLAAFSFSSSQARVLNDAARMGADGNLRHLLASGLDSCSEIMDNIDLPSGSTLNDGSKDITGSSADCCKKCDDHPNCKSWTRIKTATQYNKQGECWLRDHVPEAKSCSSCESGVGKSVEDVLNKCIEDGRTAAGIAVRGACAVLTRVCPAKKNASRTAVPAIGAKSIADVTERTCKILLEDACIRGGFALASSGQDDCASILNNGPQEVPDCPSFDAAVDIFSDAMTRACEG